jgi:hypothetical protein
VSTINVDGELRVKEYERFRMTKLLPAITGIQAIVSQKTDLASNLTNNVVFGDSLASPEYLPRWMLPFDIDVGVGDCFCR